MPKKFESFIETRVEQVVGSGIESSNFRVLYRSGMPIAVIRFATAPFPRIKNQKTIQFYFDHKKSRLVRSWIKKELRSIAGKAPKYTSITFGTHLEPFVCDIFGKLGFNIRFEILEGRTSVALNQLKKIKNPLEDLSHLGLELRPITSTREVGAIMRLQKRIAKKEPGHTYLSHRREVMENDRKGFVQAIKKKSGLLLGVYRQKKLVGLMCTTIHTQALFPKFAGISFLLDHSIQGKGIANTGYLHLLHYLKKRKVERFRGGTSQPAVKGLGQIMKRRSLMVTYLKMDL